MKVDAAQQMFSMIMMQNMLKQSFGDGMEFEIVYQTLLDSNKASLAGNGLGDYTQQSTEGMNLQQMELLLNSTYNNYYKTNSLDNYKVNDKYMEELINNTSDTERKEIYKTVDKYSKKYGVDPKLILSVIKTESGFNPNIKSSAGAMGLMQLMSFNCEAFGVTNPYDIDQNIKGGIQHLKEYLDRYNGNVEMALMAYNGGPTRMMNRGVNSPDDIYKMSKETQNYVPKVLNYYNKGVF